jgi:hypothetical protein
VEQKKSLGHGQAQHRIAQKLQALIVANSLSILAVFERQFVGQGAVGESAHQYLGASKAMSQRDFQWIQSSFQIRLDSVAAPLKWSSGPIFRTGGASLSIIAPAASD